MWRVWEIITIYSKGAWEISEEFFIFFLEAFREAKPDKRASLTTENLQKIQIENEYDLQHLLYAVIKPLCPDARREVNDDSGVGTVRSDIKILSLNTIIEAKVYKEHQQNFKKANKKK